EGYRRLDRPLPRRAERLALLPQGAQAWTTEHGEPGFVLESGARAVVVLARDGGLRTAVERHLVPYARARAAGPGAVFLRTLRTAGVTAGELEERLAEWLGQRESRTGDVAVGLVPGEGEVWVRLRAKGVDAARALARVESPVLDALGADCYGRDAETLELVVGRALLERRFTLAVAESCTGGLLGHRLTSVPGSSAYFERGVLVYSNRAKEELLGVPAEVLRVHGAVSAPCSARAWATSTVPSRTGRPRSSAPPSTRRSSSIGATPTSAGATTTRRSPTSRGRVSSSRDSPARSSTAASPARSRATATGR